MSWTSRREAVLRGRGARHVVRGPEGDLSFACALELLRTDDAFRDFVTGLLTAHPCPALRWETPPICASRIARPFEFVLVDDPLLALAPEPEVFGPYFAPLPADTTVLAVPNLGRSAMLVVPRAVDDDAVCVHFKAFLAGAPRNQVHALWRCVAETAERALSRAPLWISTAGGGVAWLHVRIESEPKYYAYRPYALDA